MLLSTIADPVRLGTGLLQIRKFTQRLCSPPTHIVQRKEAVFKNNLLVERGHAPEPEPEVEEETLPTVIVAVAPRNRFVFEFNIPAASEIVNLTGFWDNAATAVVEPEISGNDEFTA